MTFIEAVRYCKKSFNSTTLPEVLNEEVIGALLIGVNIMFGISEMC